MELTTKQLQEVEEYLQKHKFNFIDLKDEILDHIVSDIENFLSKNYAFEDAFAMVRIRWEKHFRETSSFYFGMYFSESKIVIKKALKIFKPFYFIYLAAYILPVIILKLFPIHLNESTIGFITLLLYVVATIAITYTLFLGLKTRFSKVKTTFSFIIKTQYLGTILLVLGIFLSDVFLKDGQVDALSTGFICAGFTVTFICNHFYKKHLEVIKKYKIS